MLYKFKSQATGDVIMAAPAAEQLLAVIGKAPAAQGIVDVDAIPAALAALERAVAVAAEPSTENDDDAAGQADATVGLRQRAWPLIDMLKRAHGEGKPVVWGV